MSLPAGYASVVKSISEYRIPGITGKQKDILQFISRKLIQEYERVDKIFYNQFDKLDLIMWTTNKADIPCENAIGCSTGRAVYSVFYDNPRFDSFIMSMELAHHAVGEFCRDNLIRGPHGENANVLSNDLIHRAANGMEPRYVSWIVFYIKIQSWYDKLRGILMLPSERVSRSSVRVNLFVYHMKNILEDKDKLMNEIRDGTAPSGVNEYWSGVEDSPAKNEILEWLQTYESVPHHHSH